MVKLLEKKLERIKWIWNEPGDVSERYTFYNLAFVMLYSTRFSYDSNVVKATWYGGKEAY